MDVFKEITLEVLTELDPRYELDSKDRYAAAIHGKKHQYSGTLRRGLAQSLCLIATRLADVGGTDGTGLASWIVENILETISEKDWVGWASIGDISPSLAEAAPAVFLRSIERELQNNPDVFVQLLTDESGFAGLGGCLHSGLLWALETLAWFPEHLPRVAFVLTDLAEIDPGGQWANRPLASLVDIFLAWKQHSCTPVSKRLKIIDQIISKQPTIGWTLLEKLCDRGVSSGTHRPKWRAVSPININDTDTHRYWHGLRGRYLRLGHTEPSRLANLISGRPSLQVAERVEAARSVHKIDLEVLNTENREVLRTAIRRRLHFIHSFEDPNKRNRDEISNLKDAYEYLEPADLVERHNWLFSKYWLELPTGERSNHEKYASNVARERANAAKEIFDKLGFNQAVLLALDSTFDGRFARAIGQKTSPKLDAKFVDRLSERLDDQYPLPLLNFVYGRREAVGEDWVYNQINRLQLEAKNWRALAVLSLTLPMKKSTWDFVTDLGKAVESQYWKWVGVWSAEADTEYAVQKLVEVGCVLQALDVAAMGKEHVSSETILDLIQRIIIDLSSRDEPVNSTLFDYHLEELFDCLDGRSDVNVSDIAQLEFPFAHMFDPLHSKRGLKAQDALIIENPAYFAELVSWLYKPDSGNGDDDSGLSKEQKQTRASNAYTILESLRFVPGQKATGFDSKECSDWLTDAQTRLAERNRKKSGTQTLAQVVQRTPIGDDNIWPVKELRTTIEQLSSQEFDRGLHAAFFNARGTTSRPMDEGGQQERVLADQYRGWADVIDVEAPRIAAVLRSLADTYVRHGKDEDIDARVHRIKD